MREAILEKTRRARGTPERLNFLREQLHHLLLQETDRKGGFADLCFVGGTALRLLFGLDRFSEDLDFSLSAASSKKDFDLEPLLLAVQKSLSAFGLECELKRMKRTGAVQSGYLTFTAGLLHALDRSFHPQQKFYVKFEVDTNPPAGAVEEVTPVAGERLYKVRHYDLSSLFAGKLHALLFRVYTKGRDLYDLLWYVGRGVKPNRTLLENAIAQTQKSEARLTDESLRAMLQDRLERTDLASAQKDAAPFLGESQVRLLLDRGIFQGAVKKISF